MTNDTPKTIQIFLPHGDPRGIRFAEITTRIVQVIEVPRSLLPEFLKMPESDQVALYFLFGEAEDGADPKVYIGQTGDLRARLAKHNKEKEFWERALILISRTNSLTQTHALFLEWCCLQAARKAGRYRDDNGNSGSKPHTPAPLEADCLEIYATGHSLLATLGYPIFDPVAKSPSAAAPDELFYCKATGAHGRGMYTEEGFVVLKGSIGRKDNVPSIIGTAGARLRDRLLESGTMRAQGETVIFERDHLFKSPSMAALALLGRTCNGWIDWKTQDGRTLDAVKRQTTEPA
ncbi:GIY-YIG nuclease family protein [Variovorax paradoxus]|uniref:GIY-YIG nuclease family protein n=1 Tax=Variovorax paradoxus TaxID=34073 RepID=UPI000376B1EF|nr:GIY-YIG nuclease family protein [Variovorax paradoxus]